MPWVSMKVDHCGIVRLHDVKESATWEATHAIQQRKPSESLKFQICVPKPFPLLFISNLPI